MRLIVSIISDQTVPNAQIIKEFSTPDTEHLFFSTHTIEKKKCLQHIEKACGIQAKRTLLTNDEHNVQEMTNLLQQEDYSPFEDIIVNMTGGTKLMSLAVYQFFLQIPQARILYVLTIPNTYKMIHPQEEIHTFRTSLTIQEYLQCYGNQYTTTPLSGIDADYTRNFFNFYCQNDLRPYEQQMLTLRGKRNKGIKNDTIFAAIKPLLDEARFTPETANQLSTKEVQYLTGGWFEEYIYHRVKNELQLPDDCILTGAQLIRKTTNNPKDAVSVLLGKDIEIKRETMNEFDVLFILNNRLHIIECKTSITNLILFQDSKGQIKKKEEDILSKTIYQVDALCSKLGLYAKSYIVTLSDFKQMIAEGDANRRTNTINRLTEQIDRAERANIRLIDRRRLTDCPNLNELLC